jgi:hypothetical protein
MGTVALSFVVIALAQVPGTATDCQREALTAEAAEDQVVAEFAARVEHYVKLHRTLERSLPPERMFEDAEEMFEARDALRSAIVAARPHARQGNLFTARVGQVLIDRLDRTILQHGHDPADILADINAERLPDVPEPKVNGEYPWAIGSAMWPTLLRALPPLPHELEYRFSNRDLVLIDMHANLVIDILHDALPPPTGGGRR